MKERCSEEQIAQILREADEASTKAGVCRKYGISEWTYCRWEKRYQGLVAGQVLANEALREASVRKGLM